MNYPMWIFTAMIVAGLYIGLLVLAHKASRQGVPACTNDHHYCRCGLDWITGCACADESGVDG